jgi:hypothetical protein
MLSSRLASTRQSFDEIKGYEAGIGRTAGRERFVKREEIRNSILPRHYRLAVDSSGSHWQRFKRRPNARHAR